MKGVKYRDHPGMNWGKLKAVLASPRHLELRLTEPDEDSDAKRFGRAMHVSVLEPERFDRDVITVPAEYVTAGGALSTGKAAVAWLATVDPDLLVTPAERERCLRIREAVESHEDARVWLAHATVRERELYWTDRATSVECKGRLDAFCPRLGLLWDLKGMSSKGEPISLGGIAREIASRHYHGQLAYYSAGLALQPEPLIVEAIGWVCVETLPPYDVVVVQADAQMVEEGMRIADLALRRYADARQSGQWPGVAPRMQTISLPAWAVGGGR